MTEIMNGMIESGAIQDRRERGSGNKKNEPDEEGYNLFLDPDFLRDLAADLSREQWQRIIAEKGD